MWSLYLTRSSKPVDVNDVPYFYAPQYCSESNCTATSKIDPGRCADGAYTGQWVYFDDGQGNIFTLGHTKLIPPSNGSNYKPGEPVAYVYQNAVELEKDDPLDQTIAYNGPNTDFYCWTGAHIHMKVTHNSQPVDPLAFVADMGCASGPQTELDCWEL